MNGIKIVTTSDIFEKENIEKEVVKVKFDREKCMYLYAIHPPNIKIMFLHRFLSLWNKICYCFSFSKTSLRPQAQHFKTSLGSEDQERQATEGSFQGEAVLSPGGEFVPVQVNLYFAQHTGAWGEGQEEKEQVRGRLGHSSHL